MLRMEATGWSHLPRRAEQSPASPILAAATDSTQERLITSSPSAPQKMDSGLLRVEKFLNSGKNYCLTWARRTSSRQGEQTGGCFVQSHRWLGSCTPARAHPGARRRCAAEKVGAAWCCPAPPPPPPWRCPPAPAATPSTATCILCCGQWWAGEGWGGGWSADLRTKIFNIKTRST